MRTPPQPQFFGRAAPRIHCAGVGGMGVGPLAIYLAGLGLAVSGEDDALGADMAAQLAAAGVAVRPMPEDAELLVYSSAIGASHAARSAAAARGVPAVRRGEMLAEAARGRKLVAVCGAHGKTTTTAMLITALRSANFPAGFVLGGLFADGSAPARVGSNDWLVAEIDESDGTIERFSPEITVAVNLDWDHPDFYRTAAEFEAAFAGLFGRTRSAVLVSDACSRSLRLAAGSRPAASFGRCGDFSAVIASEGAGRMTLELGGRFAGRSAEVRANGEFNASNAAGALAAAQLMQAEPGARSLAHYPGVKRRQSILSQEGGITVLEDYAHHPTEIRALLGSLRRRVSDSGRLVVVFQPHRYSRTAQFAPEFAAALGLADQVHLLDVYGAGEAPVAGGTSADIYAELKRGPNGAKASYLPGGSGAGEALGRDLRPGDLVAFVGAGDIERHARDWLEHRKRQSAQADRWDDLARRLQDAIPGKTRIRREEPLGKRTTLRVGGAARLYAEPAGEDDLRELLRAAAREAVPVFMLGRGSNLIVPDEGVDGLVLTLAGEAWSGFEPLPDGSVRVGAGLRLKNLCGMAAAAGLQGFEFLEGIPGSVGGALRMNAGAMGGWMFDVVEEVELMTLQGHKQTFRKADLHVKYRCCEELLTSIALAAKLRPSNARASAAAPAADPAPRRAALPPPVEALRAGAGDEPGLAATSGPRAEGDPAATAAALGREIERQIDVYRRRRHETQPREPSAGCIFKNPPGGSAGRLIDESGLKGERVGGAEVSAVHANFIINRSGATSADVLELIRRVRLRVRERTGVELEPEALLFGKNWEEVL